MLDICFEGWFQCRLANDPDPTDEPRGVSGHTFALVGEPDLDRIIRFQNPVTPRTPGPNVDVTVTSVSLDTTPEPNHPLIGARVDLLPVLRNSVEDGPKFVEQNGVIVAPDTTVIAPFFLQISKGSELVLQRQAVWDPQHPDLTVYDAAPEQLKPRQPNTVRTNSVEVRDATGVMDRAGFIKKRIERLKGLLAKATDPTEQAGLQQRIRAFSFPADDWRMQRLMTLLWIQTTFIFDLNGPGAVVDSQHVLDTKVSLATDWPLDFWMGGWDSDVLCAYVRGQLSVPLT